MAISGTLPLKKAGSSARRCLFGKPDPERVRKDLDKALAEMDRSAKSTLRNTWGFDADLELAVPGGRFEYSKVGPTEYVPCVYTRPYVTRNKSVFSSPCDDDSVSVLDYTDSREVVSRAAGQLAAPATVSTSTQTVRGLDSPAATGTVIASVRRLDFKENCTSSSSPSSQLRSRSSRSTTVQSSMMQSTMTDHFQPRKRRLADIESSALPRGKSPRL